MESGFSVYVLLVAVLQGALQPLAGRQPNITIDLVDIYRRNLGRVVQLSDRSVPPCEDFFAHACGNFARSLGAANADSDYSGEEGATSAPPPYLYNAEDRAHFFEEHKRSFTSKPGVILRELYDACKERTHSDVIRGLAPTLWQRMLREIPFLTYDKDILAAWPFLQHQWAALNNTYGLDWRALAAQFAAHGVPNFLNIFFTENTIYIAPVERVACPAEETITASLLPMLATSRNPQIAQIVGYEFSVLCRLLSGQLQISAELNELNAPDIIVDDTLTIYFQHFFSILNFTETEVHSARKIPVEEQRLSDTLNVLRATEPRILYNYVLWHAYESLKYRDCFQLTSEWKQFLHAEYWHWAVFEPYVSRDVAMAKYLLRTTRFQRQRLQTLMGADWERFLQPKLKRKDFNVKRLIQNYAHSKLNVDKLVSIYAGLSSRPPLAFYTKLLELRRLRLRSTFHEALDDGEDDANHPASFMEHFLHYNILTLKQPLYHFFATQGFDMWHVSNILYSTDGLYTAWDCLERQLALDEHSDEQPAGQQHVDLLHKARYDADEVKQVFLFYRAFIESHSDYKFWLESELFAFVEDVVLANFAMDSERIMFYAVAQLYCGRNDDFYSLLVNRSFRNMPEFQQAFQCSTDRAMNPIVKCMMRKC